MDLPVLFAATGDAVARIVPRVDGAEVTMALGGAGVQCVAAAANRVFAGTFDQGLFRSMDGGTTWEPAGEGIPHPRVLAVAISAADGAVFVGTEPSLVCRSDDDGATWETFPSMLDLPSAPTWSFPPRPWTHHVRWLAPHRSDPDLWIVGIELGGVLRTTDGGKTWEDRHTDACIDPHVLLTHPQAHDRVYEVAGDGVAWSADAGETWTKDIEGMDVTYSWGLAVDRADPDLWFVSSAPGPDRAHGRTGDACARLWRRRVGTGWEPLVVEGHDGPLDRMPYSLVTLPDRPRHLLVGFDDGRIIVTPDAGETWRDLGVSLPDIQQIEGLAP